MQWRLLHEANLKALYDCDVVRDFPATERKPFSNMTYMLSSSAYHAWGVFDDAADGESGPLAGLRAYLLVACPANCRAVLLDYFAVLPAWRSAGLGAALVAELSAREEAPVLLEVEWPAHAPDAALAERRLNFYRRCGAHLTGGWDRAYRGLFVVMVLPGGAPMSDREADEELCRCYRAMLPGAELNENFAYGRLNVEDLRKLGEA